MSNQITTEYIENRITNLNKIDKWTERIEEIKNIKNDIGKENDNIDNILATLDNITVKNKEYNIDKIINDFSKSDLSKKIKYYQYLNNYIKKIESEL